MAPAVPGPHVYDRIGRGYAVTRRPDPRIAAAVRSALGDAASVVNVGAGAGSYEPVDLRVVAVEPAPAMIAQRSAGAAPAVRGVAEHLPFADGAFDAALAVLTVHHWTDRARGLAELARVARRRVVVLTWDPACPGPFWIIEYVPGILDLDVLARALGEIDARPLPVPADCVDGFLGAFWRRPEAYLDPAVRGAISGFAQLGEEAVAPGLARLDADLRSGCWDARFGHLRRLDSLDLGYRLVVAERPRGRR
jgi:SAM-dependent methyltransferase